MSLLRITSLALLAMAVFLVASLLYTMPRRPPDLKRAKSDFLRDHRSCSVEVVEMHDMQEDHMSFWIRYRGFASNTLEDAVYSYRRVKGNGWQLEATDP
jgi:hypothetical protein